MLNKNTRRQFLKNGISFTGAAAGMSLLPLGGFANITAEDDSNIVGPKEGFAPQVGTLVSMMNWMRTTMLYSVQKLTQAELDFLFDEKSNTIGAMLLHLAATETFYAIHTFDNVPWGRWEPTIANKYKAAMMLGDEGRTKIKGNELRYYLDELKERREKTLAEFKKRDDKWLMAVDKEWPWGPTNNYCKWFHVCEHESNHNGQIKWIASRLPGRKSSGD